MLFEKFNFHPFDSLTDEPKDHDAFLLYTEEDRVWALETLCAYLNRKGYKVTDKDHFDPGGYTINQLDTALGKEMATIELSFERHNWRITWCV